MSADPSFVHLHVHSAYSLLEGAMTIGKLAEFAKADKQPALALTDTDNMFGGLEFSEKLAGSGIQPIVGCTLAVDFGDEARDPRQPVRTKPLPRVVFLATSEDGYRRLAKLSSRAFLETPSTEKAHLKLGWLGLAGSLLLLTFEILTSLQIHFLPTSLPVLLVILTVLAAGLGLIARGLRPS